MRLSKDDILEAFDTTGMTPVRRTFGNDEQGCGIKAFANAHREEYRGLPRLVSLLGIGQPYFEGFTTGWDSGKTDLSDDLLLKQYGGPEGVMRYFDGLEDGRVAAEAVFARAGSRELVTV